MSFSLTFIALHRSSSLPTASTISWRPSFFLWLWTINCSVTFLTTIETTSGPLICSLIPVTKTTLSLTSITSTKSTLISTVSFLGVVSSRLIVFFSRPIKRPALLLLSVFSNNPYILRHLNSAFLATKLMSFHPTSFFIYFLNAIAQSSCSK